MTHLDRIILSVALVTGLVALGAAGCGDTGTEAEAQSALPSSSGQAVAEADVDLNVGVPEPVDEPVLAEATPMPEDAEGLDAPTPELFEAEGITLRRMALTRSVEGREPVDPAMAFPAEQRPLYAFLDVANANEEDVEVVVTFERPDGQSVGHVSLDIPAEAPRWRTWALSRMITEPGAWTAEVRTADGALLGRIPFDIEG